MPYVGLPNVLAGRFVVPEFIQNEATPEKLAEALLAQFADKDGQAALTEVFEAMHLELKQGTAEKAAKAILRACDTRNGAIMALLWFEGLVAGVDEAGRGPLAGPVVAAAVILDLTRPIEGLNDSKKLSEKARERLAIEIREKALAWAIAEASPAEIDRVNILQATFLAMRRAVEALATSPDSASHRWQQGAT